MKDELTLKLPDYKHTCPRYTTGNMPRSRCLACAFEDGAKAQLAKRSRPDREKIAEWLRENYNENPYTRSIDWANIDEDIRDIWRGKADQILALYDKPKEKPPLLSDEEMTVINNNQPSEAKYGDVFKAIAQAQRDSDIKWYEGVE